jgi:hypothetical protein
MTGSTHRNRSGLAGRLMIALALVLTGALLAAWALARFDGAARFLGVAPEARQPLQIAAPQPVQAPPQATLPQSSSSGVEVRIGQLEQRLRMVESTAQQVAGSAGRADALLVAFAARRAIDRGLQLGYLEPLLVERFGPTHPRAVSTIISAARAPLRLSDLQDRYAALGPELRSTSPEAGWWAEVRQEIGSLISVRRADSPSRRPDARYQRALDHLGDGAVDAALAETMRLPGAGRAGEWIRDARRYVLTQRALDEIETAALLGSGRDESL